VSRRRMLPRERTSGRLSLHALADQDYGEVQLAPRGSQQRVMFTERLGRARARRLRRRDSEDEGPAEMHAFRKLRASISMVREPHAQGGRDWRCRVDLAAVSRKGRRSQQRWDP
jgi:hypothetical protein